MPVHKPESCPHRKRLGKNVASLRACRDLTQEGLAEKSGRQHPLRSNVEAGDNFPSLPSWHAYVPCCAAIGTNCLPVAKRFDSLRFGVFALSSVRAVRGSMRLPPARREALFLYRHNQFIHDVTFALGCVLAHVEVHIWSGLASSAPSALFNTFVSR